MGRKRKASQQTQSYMPKLEDQTSETQEAKMTSLIQILTVSSRYHTARTFIAYKAKLSEKTLSLAIIFSAQKGRSSDF